MSSFRTLSVAALVCALVTYAPKVEAQGANIVELQRCGFIDGNKRIAYPAEVSGQVVETPSEGGRVNVRCSADGIRTPSQVTFQGPERNGRGGEVLNLTYVYRRNGLRLCSKDWQSVISAPGGDGVGNVTVTAVFKMDGTC